MARRSRADRGSAVAKVRVYELAKEFGVESKAVMAKLQEMGEFVRSASSTIEAPVVRRLKNEFSAEGPKPQGRGSQGQGAPARRPEGTETAAGAPARPGPAAAPDASGPQVSDRPQASPTHRPRARRRAARRRPPRARWPGRRPARVPARRPRPRRGPRFPRCPPTAARRPAPLSPAAARCPGPGPQARVPVVQDR